MSAAKSKTSYSAAEITALEQKILEQQNEIESLKKQLDHMTEIFANAQRARFGQSSEKSSYVLGKDQLSFFNEAEAEQNSKAEEPTEETFTVAAHTRKKKKTLDEKIADIPVEEVVLDLPESQRFCSKCGSPLRMIGRKFVRREMIMIPQTVKILEYYTCTYACECCEKDTGFATIVSTKAPPPLMKHSLASPSTVADVMTKKYVDGLPLARQEKIWARQGVDLSRSTLANWVIQTTKIWLKPLYQHMKQQIRRETLIHADETVVQVLKEPDKLATSESRMWVYASGEASRTPVRIFEYQPDRKGERAKNFLHGFTGFLVTDGYAGYNKVENVTRCGCWAHTKRKWREAMPQGATVKTCKAAVGYQYCNKLFALEKKCKDMKAQYKQEFRQNQVLPILEEYFCWLNTLNPEQGSKLYEAVTYSLNQKTALMAFVDHSEVPISNNLAENAIRPFTLGRKNWLFCDSVKGAEASAVAYTMVETAKANGLDPYDYLLYVLSMMPYLGKSPAQDRLESLMPWAPEIQEKYIRDTEP